MFSSICAWINEWVNNREAGDLRRHRAHYDVIVMTAIVRLGNTDRTIHYTKLYRFSAPGTQPCTQMVSWMCLPEIKNRHIPFIFCIGCNTLSHMQWICCSLYKIIVKWIGDWIAAWSTTFVYLTGPTEVPRPPPSSSWSHEDLSRPEGHPHTGHRGRHWICRKGGNALCAQPMRDGVTL